MNQFRSEDIELPKYYDGDVVNKYEQNDEENENKKKKIIIVIVVIGGVLMLGAIIFLVIYFSQKNKKEGGYILVKHELDYNDEATIFNIGNFKEDEFKIEDITIHDSVSGRLLEENNYDINNGVLKFNDNIMRVGIIECKIKFNNILTKIDGMFKDIKSLLSADFSELISEKIKNMDSLFLNCENLYYANFKNFNSKKVESMISAFENCKNLYEIDLSSFETPKLRSLKCTFKNCINLEYINLKNFELNNNIVDRENIFEGDYNLQHIEVDNVNTNNILMAENKNLNMTNSTNYNYNLCEEGKDEKCQKCNDNKCSSCNEGYFFPNYATINKCKKCYKGCKICSDYMNCTKCNENGSEKYILKGDKCEKYIENPINTNNIIQNPTTIIKDESDIIVTNKTNIIIQDQTIDTYEIGTDVSTENYK